MRRSCIIVIEVLRDLFLLATRCDIVTAAVDSFESPSLALVEPPVPNNDKHDVEQVKGHHGDSFPQVELAVDNEAHAEACSDNEEAHVTNEALPRDVEGANQGHRPGDNRCDEAGSTDKLAHSQTRSVCTKGSESGEDVWTAVAKCQQGHTGQTLAHAQHARDGVQVDAEEVAGGDTDS